MQWNRNLSSLNNTTPYQAWWMQISIHLIPLEFLNSSFLRFTRNFSILCQHCWYSALNTAKYPMANSIVLWSNHRIISRYPMGQSEILQNIRTSEVISHEAKPSVISLHECEYFRYLTMDHAISVLSYGLITCSSISFPYKSPNS